MAPTCSANPGFESGAASWTHDLGRDLQQRRDPPHAGSWFAWLDGYGTSHTDSISQTVTIPAASTATLSFYLSISPVTRRRLTTAYDTLKVQVTPSGGATSTLATYSNLNKGTGYVAPGP